MADAIKESVISADLKNDYRIKTKIDLIEVEPILLVIIEQRANQHKPTLSIENLTKIFEIVELPPKEIRAHQMPSYCSHSQLVIEFDASEAV